MKEVSIDDGDYEIDMWEYPNGNGISMEVCSERDNRYTWMKISFNDIRKLKEFINSLELE